MEEFEIQVRTVAGSKYLFVSPKVVGKNTRYEIWENNRHIFSLESSSETAMRDLQLTAEFSNKGIYTGFVHAVSDVINSSESSDGDVDGEVK